MAFPYVPPEELERAIARTGEKYIGDIQTIFAQVAALYEQRLVDRDALIATVREEKDAVIAEVRRRAEAAEAERDGLKAAQAALRSQSEVESSARGEDTPEAAVGLWGRLARWWRG